MEQLLLGAPPIHDVDDPLCTFIVASSLISKDFTGGSRPKEIVHLMFAYQTMVSRRHFHQIEGHLFLYFHR